MKTTIDRFGRVVIPKALRDRLGISPGTALTVSEGEDAVVMRVLRNEPQLTDEDGILVFTGEPTDDLEEAVERERRKRQEQILRDSW